MDELTRERWTDLATSCGVPMRFTIKRGPSSGVTAVTCTCGWDRTLRTVIGAKRSLAQHIKTASAPYAVTDVRPPW